MVSLLSYRARYLREKKTICIKCFFFISTTYLFIYEIFVCFFHFKKSDKKYTFHIYKVISLNLSKEITKPDHYLDIYHILLTQNFITYIEKLILAID